MKPREAAVMMSTIFLDDSLIEPMISTTLDTTSPRRRHRQLIRQVTRRDAFDKRRDIGGLAFRDADFR